MRYRNHPLRDAVVLALIASTGSLAAEQAQAQSATDLDTVVVTGTRIKSQTMTASSPVTEISAEEFEKVGATTVEELVNQYPQLTLSNDNFENNGSTGYSTVSLRDLGALRTLTLVNGRRLPPGTTSEVPDISIVPPAALKRTDVLTGGASAVYGADAVAGVVNFVLDDEFQGVKANFGYSTYRHDNSNGYIQSLMDDAGYSYPTGKDSSGGTTKNIDLVVGGDIGDRGHMLSWLTWRENDALLQGDRDYSSCALNNAGTACGGSGTAPDPNFIVLPYAGMPNTINAHQNADGSWERGFGGFYNYAPINYYQRPDTRLTAGSHIKYEVNDHFKPYLEAMFLNRDSGTQIAESGTFFNSVDVRCDDAIIGSFCNDLGIDTDDLTVLVGKRNVEGGPRFTQNNTTTYNLVTGAEGEISDYWTYDASFQFARNEENTTGRNDFLSDRIQSAVLQCPPGSFAGCLPYNVWVPNGVTPEAAAALAGVSHVNTTTYLKAFNGFVSGDLGFGLPSAKGDTIKLVAGYEWRENTYKVSADANSVAGNFAGAGGKTNETTGSVSVSEVFMEASIPLITDVGVLSNLGAELGYRNSDYSTSGRVNTFKAGLGADFADGKYRIRTGWNRAIRAPTITDLFLQQSVQLFNGEDRCAGPTPKFSPEQCANTGVSAAQYGNITPSPAGQYNQFVGGNPDLKPEEAETFTFGVAATPIRNLDLSIDYYDIKVEKQIGSIGANVILNGCATTGNPILCNFVRRDAATGDLWTGQDEDAGQISNLRGNNGVLTARGIDLIGRYAFDLGAGRMSASLNGNYVLEQGQEPFPALPELNYDCAGKINTSCQLPEWRHIANIGYSIGRYNFNLRWRYIGELDYENTDGTTVDLTDTIVSDNGNKIDAYNYFDLSASARLGDHIDWTIGVNNIADKEPPLVGNTLATNGNSPGGYDQAGRFVFTNVSFRF
ncbi:TonB-dependent receptor domain-containing protein [Pseudoxanthomonas dokdonensis]|uniref:TonB-dependent receptor n=1 Tax=Pseudoxanthomonas dokdonensis TaxID=344882 RepID=A0A0R0CVT1_9GAMM|nr:TonB-dependent receptor [Pseudoxanthomonas dokdonensis]KRG70490.1 TonB-dependent receptor [Pseudoxanthomonas dokdonensis]